MVVAAVIDSQLRARLQKERSALKRRMTPLAGLAPVTCSAGAHPLSPIRADAVPGDGYQIPDSSLRWVSDFGFFALWVALPSDH
jgi:hypothetical protein